MGEKLACSTCQKTYPATTEYFFKGDRYKNGLRPRCKGCAYKKYRKTKSNSISENEIRLSEKHWSKVDLTESCWLWKGACNDRGYGQTVKSQQRYYVHRLAYIEFIGPIKEGMTIDHLCLTPNCLNPYHLEQVSMGENSARGSCATQRANITGYRGVHRMKDRYAVRIKKINLGVYGSAEEAAHIYDQFAQVIFGTLARLNHGN